MGPISKPTPKHHRAITSGFTDHVSSLSAAFASDDKDEDLFCYTRVCVDFSSFFSLSFTPPLAHGILFYLSTVNLPPSAGWELILH